MAVAAKMRGSSRLGRGLPPEVTGILAEMLAGVRRALDDNLAGVYVRGSLATGDFDPGASDVDLLVATQRRVQAPEFDALAALHARLAAAPNPFGNRMEVSYVDRAALRRFEPGLLHPTLGQGEALAWSEHRANWILERWSVREHGAVLCGPAPRGLIDPISPGELRRAVRARLQDWAAWAGRPDDPDWALPRRHKAYVVATMCRALYTLTFGTLVGKPRAVAWGIEVLPEPWRTTVLRSRAWRIDDTPDPGIASEVMRFVRWAAAWEPVQERRHP